VYSSHCASCVRLEDLTTVRMAMFFWVVMPCRLEGRYQRFGATYCLHLQGWAQKNIVTALHTLYSSSKRYWSDQIKKDEVGGACSMQGWDEKCKRHCSQKILRKETDYSWDECIGPHGSIILKWNIREIRVRECELDWSGPRYGPVTGFPARNYPSSALHHRRRGIAWSAGYERSYSAWELA
jgi:hypothetical protein